MARKNYYGAQFNQSPTIVEKAGAEDLLKLQKALDDRLVESMPMHTQLNVSAGKQEIIESGYLI